MLRNPGLYLITDGGRTNNVAPVLSAGGRLYGVLLQRLDLEQNNFNGEFDNLVFNGPMNEDDFTIELEARGMT